MIGKTALSLRVVLIGSVLWFHGCGTPRTRADWRDREAHLESLAQSAAQAMVKRIRESQGLQSDEGMRLLYAGARLNEISLDLLSETGVEESVWQEMDSIFGQSQFRSGVEDEVLTQALLVVDELLPLSREDQRARLWLGLFLHSFSHTLLEGFEHELAL
jgi:hypothetical protein